MKDPETHLEVANGIALQVDYSDVAQDMGIVNLRGGDAQIFVAYERLCLAKAASSISRLSFSIGQTNETPIALVIEVTGAFTVGNSTLPFAKKTYVPMNKPCVGEEVVSAIMLVLILEKATLIQQLRAA